MRKIFTLLFSLLLLPLVAWGQQITIDLGQEDQTLSSGTYIISNYSGPNRIIIAEGAEVTITLQDVNITASADVSPFDASKAQSVTLLLKGDNSLTATNQAPGLYTPVGGSITIRDAEGDDTVGSLSATGARYWPGIGIKDGENTNITIESGAITAKGGPGAAGIGGSTGGSGFVNGTVTISGGTVTATGQNGGSGIGGGWGSNTPGPGGTVVISGGIVTATGGYGGAGIGGGTSSFSTGTSGSAIIMASSISDNSKQNDWDGIFFIGNENSGKVYGDVTLQEDWAIGSGQTLEIPDGSTLTVPDDVTLTNNGTITGEGIIRGNIPDGWTGKVACMLTYDLNGGTGTAPEGGYEIAGETVTLPETISFTKAGYTCIGWAESKEDTEALPSFTMLKKAVTLYAVWKRNEFTLKEGIIPQLTYDTPMESINLSTWLSENAETDCGEITFASESLPAGLKIDGNILSGTPTAATNEEGAEVTITAKAENGSTAEQKVTIVIGKATSALTITSSPNDPTYGDKLTLKVKPEVATPTTRTTAQNTVELKKGEVVLATATQPDADGTYTLTYDTQQKGLVIGENKLTVSFGGSGGLNASSEEVTVTLNKKQVSATVQNTIMKGYDGDTSINLTLQFSDLVEGDVISVIVPSDFADPNVGSDKPITLGTPVWVDGADAAQYYDITLPSDVTGIISSAEINGGVTIQGTVQYGHTLTASYTGDANVTYQWKREGIAIENATSNTYELTEADIDKAITVTVTAVAGGNYDGSITSAPVTVEKASLNEDVIQITTSESTIELGSEGTILTATIIGITEEDKAEYWKWESGDESIATVTRLTPADEATTRTTGEPTSTAQVTPVGVGTATITVTYDSPIYKGEKTYTVTVTEKESPAIPDHPEYYNIMVEECEGVTVETSTNVVREGTSMTFTVNVAEGYTDEDMVVKVKRSLFGYTEVIEPNEEGIYEVKNIYTDIYITVDGVEEEEEETPTGMEELEGAKVYTKDGSIYVQTPKQEQVQIISISGAVLKNEQLIGLQRYDLPRGIYIICIDEERFKVRN